MNDFARLKLMGLLACSVAVGVASLPAFSDAGGSRLLGQFTPHDRLYSIAFNGDFGEAVGDSGLVVQTRDGGKTWGVETDPPTQLAMFSVAIAGARSIAVGQEGLILIRDGRQPWKKLDPITDKRLLRVSVNKDGLAVAVGAFGTLLKSTDNGKTWTELKPDWATLYKTDATGDFVTVHDEPTLYVAKVFDDGSIVIGGEYGQLNRSTDGGTTWTRVFQSTSAKQAVLAPSFFGMHFDANGTGYAAGQDGLIAMTTDSGKTWNNLESNTKASLFDIASTPDGKVFAVGMRTCLYSGDGGKNWTTLKALDLNLNWYSGLDRGASSDEGSMIAVGHSGRLLKLAATDAVSQ